MKWKQLHYRPEIDIGIEEERPGNYMAYPDRKEDITLWKKCLNGDREAWDTLVSNYSEAVCITIRYELKKSLYHLPIDCKDVNQDVFELILQKLYQWEGRASLKTYIKQIASNATINWIRKTKPERFRVMTITKKAKSEGEKDKKLDILDTIEDRETDPDLLIEKIAKKELQRFLTQKERYLFVLHYEEGRPFPEIAEHLNKKVGAIHIMHYRVIAKLKKSVNLKKTNRTISS